MTWLSTVRVVVRLTSCPAFRFLVLVAWLLLSWIMTWNCGVRLGLLCLVTLQWGGVTLRVRVYLRNVAPGPKDVSLVFVTCLFYSCRTIVCVVLKFVLRQMVVTIVLTVLFKSVLPCWLLATTLDWLSPSMLFRLIRWVTLV